MAYDKKYNKSDDLHDDSDDDGSQTGSQSGQIEFKDFLANAENQRDDLLSADEVKRLLSVHTDLNELGIKKAKEEMENRRQLKEGKEVHQRFDSVRGYGAGAGSQSQYMTNPKLDVAQFQGADKQTTKLPNLFETLANEDDRKEHELQHDLQHKFQHQFQPSNAPRLTRN